MLKGILYYQTRFVLEVSSKNCETTILSYLVAQEQALLFSELIFQHTSLTSKTSTTGILSRSLSPHSHTQQHTRTHEHEHHRDYSPFYSCLSALYKL